ncbi:MAG: hypothetical protein HY731_10635, partial [Candidatus Tectomicrobia bacterium]|nr:hypothetical protein [Candidatus Tectomicrobia bacterium]
MELLFIRNAESEGDDDRLTSRGFAMARQVGQTLQSLKVSHVFGSSLPSDKVTSDFLTLYH